MKTILALILGLAALSSGAQPVKYQYFTTNSGATVSNGVTAIADARSLIATQAVTAVLNADIAAATNALSGVVKAYADAATNSANTVMTNRVAVQRLNTAFLTADYTVTTNDFAVEVDSTSGDKNIQLPLASTCLGQVFEFSKSSSDLNAVNILRAGSDTINDVDSIIISNQYEVWRLMSLGTRWSVR